MKTKTYAQQQKAKQTDWLKVLKPGLNYERLEYLEGLAAGWPTCACGNMCSTLPRYNAQDEDSRSEVYEGMPKNRIVKELGYDFHHSLSNATVETYEDCFDQAIVDQHVEEARKIFMKIEAKVASVIKKQRADKKRKSK